MGKDLGEGMFDPHSCSRAREDEEDIVEEPEPKTK